MSLSVLVALGEIQVVLRVVQLGSTGAVVLDTSDARVVLRTCRFWNLVPPRSHRGGGELRDRNFPLIMSCRKEEAVTVRVPEMKGKNDVGKVSDDVKITVGEVTFEG